MKQDAVAAVRAARKQISIEAGHDPHKLVERLMRESEVREAEEHPEREHLKSEVDPNEG